MKMFNFCGGCGRALSRMSGFCPPCEQAKRYAPRPQQKKQVKKQSR